MRALGSPVEKKKEPAEAEGARKQKAAVRIKLRNKAMVLGWDAVFIGLGILRGYKNSKTRPDWP